MVEISLDFQRFERDLWRGIGRKHITFWKVDGVASVVVPASSWPTVSDMQKRWVLPGKKTHQHADLIQHGIQNNNQTSKIIRFSKTSGFVCKPRVFEQTLEKLRFWICEVYIKLRWINQNPQIFTSPRFFGIPARWTAAEDGFSIGSNDLTQLTLGLDRDSGDRLGASECHGSHEGWVPGQRWHRMTHFYTELWQVWSVEWVSSNFRVSMVS